MSWNALPEAARAFAEHELTESQFRVLRARMDKIPWRTIALDMDIDEATVRGHYDRALRRMKPFYEEVRKAAA